MITLQNGIHWSHFWCQDIVLNIKRKGIAEAVITKYRGFVNKHQRQKKNTEFLWLHLWFNKLAKNVLRSIKEQY